MQKNVILVIAVIVCLALGAGGAYMYSSSQVNKLTNENTDFQAQIDYLLTRVATLSSEKNKLQNQVSSLTDEKTTLQTQISTLDNEKTSLEARVNSLTSENTELNTTIDLLAASIDAMHSNEWVQNANYNITAGTVMTQSFVLDKYGIIWDTVVYFSGTSLRVVYYYWYQGIRYYVGSFSRSLIIKNNPDVTYYGPQDYLYGTNKIDIMLDWRGGTQVWINYLTLTQFPEVRMNGNMFVDIIS